MTHLRNLLGLTSRRPPLRPFARPPPVVPLQPAVPAVARLALQSATMLSVVVALAALAARVLTPPSLDRRPHLQHPHPARVRPNSRSYTNTRFDEALVAFETFDTLAM